MNNTIDFGRDNISRILFHLSPPVMIAQLIQALYNMVDSFFIGRYAAEALTALSIIFPIQLLMIAIAVGVGVGTNTVMAACLGREEKKEADEYASVSTPLIAFIYLIFAALCWFIMPFYAKMSSNSALVSEYVVIYGRIVCLLSFGLFFESVWTKVLQAEGNMKTPMYAQITGAVINIILDPILIFGLLGVPEMGIAGASFATAAGQIAAAVIVSAKGRRTCRYRFDYRHHIGRIIHYGIPNILMESAYTVYIFGLNLILAGFSDQAVTVLGLYYKWQTFFFIPFNAMLTCIVPVISFNYAAIKIDRCRRIVSASLFYGIVFMMFGVLCFELIPGQMLFMFSEDPLVMEIGIPAFRIIGLCFFPIVTAFVFPVFFQAIGEGHLTTSLTVLRTIILFVPLGYLLSLINLTCFWFTFPLTDTITSLAGFLLYRKFMHETLSDRIYK